MLLPHLLPFNNGSEIKVVGSSSLTQQHVSPRSEGGGHLSFFDFFCFLLETSFHPFWVNFKRILSLTFEMRCRLCATDDGQVDVFFLSCLR